MDEFTILPENKLPENKLQSESKNETPKIKDMIVFCLIFVVILMWSYTIYNLMLCCFNWSTKVYRTTLGSVVASSIVTIIAIIIVIISVKIKKN